MLGDIIQSRMKEMGVNDKWIVAKTGLSESTVTRITGGKKDSFTTSSLARVCYVLDLSTDEVLSEANMILGGRRYKDIVDANEKLKSDMANLVANCAEEKAAIQSDLDQARAEIELIKAQLTASDVKYAALAAENELLRVKLELKDEIIATHKYYITKA